MSNKVDVSDESLKIISAFAKQKGLELGESCDALVSVAKSRINALLRYAKKQAGEPVVALRASKGAGGKSSKPAKKAKKIKTEKVAEQ